MKYTLEALMQSVGCTRYPARWHEIFDTVMGDFDKNGCPLADPAYYDELQKTYGIFDKHLSVYKQAAVAVAKREDLCRFLSLLAAMVADREHCKADLKELSAPYTPDDDPDIGVNMLTGLALCAALPYTAELVKKREVPPEIAHYILNIPEAGVDFYRVRHGGVDGFNLIDWFQLAVEAHLFRIGRLEIEICAKFRGRARVFENGKGERIALADGIDLHRSGFALGAKHYEDEADSWRAEIDENDTRWRGNPFDARGFVKREIVELPKSEWRLILAPDDPVVSLHIPGDNTPFTPEAVDATIAKTRAVLAKHFPDFKYKAFVCGSWLLDPQLVDLLGEKSNISHFCRRFTPITRKSAGRDVFSFIFHCPDTANVDIAGLPENTRLERALKAHYLDGKAIYEMYGYFL